MSRSFETRGRMSQIDACEQVILGLEPDGDIAKAIAVAEVSALTEVEETEEAVVAAMRAASERLIQRKIPGVRNVRSFGWVRMTDQDLIERYGADRERRGRRQFRRLARAAAAADPEKLTGAARLRRDFQISISVRIAEIDSRRAQRRRPPELTDES